jgi:hypothetical protein
MAITFEQIERLINETTCTLYADIEDRSQQEFDLNEQLIAEEFDFSEHTSNYDGEVHILSEFQKIDFQKKSNDL